MICQICFLQAVSVCMVDFRDDIMSTIHVGFDIFFKYGFETSIPSYFRQFSKNINKNHKINTSFVNAGLRTLEANKTGLNLTIYKLLYYCLKILLTDI